MNTDELKKALSHVLWIGGAPDAGKTTVATLLAERHGLQLYVFDRQEPEHLARLDPGRQPNLSDFVGMSMDQRWVLRRAEEMATTTIQSWTERFWMAVDDLLAMPRQTRIVAEGPGFFPECVQPLITSPHQAVWLVPSPAFKWLSANNRGKPTMPNQTSDPERATQNWFQRDMLLAVHVRHQAAERRLTLIEADETRTVAETVQLVEHHFAPFLSAPTPGTHRRED